MRFDTTIQGPYFQTFDCCEELLNAGARTREHDIATEIS